MIYQDESVQTSLEAESFSEMEFLNGYGRVLEDLVAQNVVTIAALDELLIPIRVMKGVINGIACL